jgi:ATP-binding cassette subfamily B protein
VPLSFWRSASSGRFSEGTMASLRHRLAACFAALPAAQIEARHSGDLLAVVKCRPLATPANGRHVSALGRLAVHHGLGALVALFAISWQLALVSTLLVPVMFLIMSRISQPVAQRAQGIQEALGDAVASAQDSLAGLIVTRTFNLSAIMDARFGDANAQVLTRGLSLTRYRALADGAGAIFAYLPFSSLWAMVATWPSRATSPSVACSPLSSS